MVLDWFGLGSRWAGSGGFWVGPVLILGWLCLDLGSGLVLSGLVHLVLVVSGMVLSWFWVGSGLVLGWF